MCRIDISELPQQTDEEIGTGETYAVERDGKVVAYVVPVKPRDESEVRAVTERVAHAVDASLSEGYTSEDLARDLDISRPFNASR
ncbi:MAG: hypothetical protein IT306_08715 [Chloroflexi bacterium]|nr:hypothetical protein [Chloroflexota bacterium]